MKDSDQSRALCADYSNRLWADTIARTLSVLQDETGMIKLELKGSPCEVEEAGNRAQNVCALFVELVVRTAAHRCWSMSTWELPPEQWNGLLSSNEQDAQDAWGQLKKDYQVVQKARAALGTNTHAEHEARCCGHEKFQQCSHHLCSKVRFRCDHEKLCCQAE